PLDWNTLSVPLMPTTRGWPLLPVPDSRTEDAVPSVEALRSHVQPAESGGTVAAYVPGWMSPETSHCPSSMVVPGTRAPVGPDEVGSAAAALTESPPKLNRPDIVVPRTHPITTSAPTMTTPTNANGDENSRFGGSGSSVMRSGSDSAGRLTASVSPAF